MKDFFINCIPFLLGECLWQSWPEVHSVLYMQKLLCLCRCVLLRCCWPGPIYRPSSLLLILCKYLGWTYSSSQSLVQERCGSHSSTPVILFGAWLPLLAHRSLPCTERCNDLLLVPQQITISLWLDTIKNIYKAYENLLICCCIASVLFHFLYQLIKLLLYCIYIMR